MATRVGVGVPYQGLRESSLARNHNQFYDHKFQLYSRIMGKFIVSAALES